MGLDQGPGSTLDIDLTELGAAVVDVAADSIPIITAAGLSKQEAIADLADKMAGTASATGLVDVSGTLKVSPSDETAVLADGFLVTMNVAGAPHKDATADIVALVAGTASATGLTAAAGVLKVDPVDAAVVVAADSVVIVNAAGVPKKDAIADLATAMADNVGIVSSAGVHALKAAGVTRGKLAGGFSKISFASGTASAANVTVAGMVVGDELVGVIAFSTAAVLATVADRVSEYVVGAGVLTKAAGTNETGNLLIIFWNDLT